MFNASLVRASFLCAALVFAGCSSPHVAATGYIPTGVALRKQGDLVSSWRKPGLSPSDFGRVVIRPVETPQGDAYGNLTDEQLAKCRSILQAALGNSFGDGIGSGSKTLVVHAAITAIKPNQPLRNIAPQTQLLKRGYGYAACELYATDGDGGPVVAAFMETTDTARFGTEKLSETGTAEQATGKWATAFRELIGK